MRLCKLALVLMFLGLADAARGQDEAALQKAALALEKMQIKIIQQHEPSIACILVSRSELYEEFGQGPDKDHPGKLGSFDARKLDDNDAFRREKSKEKKLQWLKLLDFTHPAYVPRAYGSGVVIDSKGLILTNYHVVQDATKIFVRIPNARGCYADIYSADPRSDLAILKVRDDSILPLKAVTLGDADKLQRGNYVLTLSNPYAVGFRDGQPSASYGILSNIRRRTLTHLKEDERVKPFQYYGTLLQTDARLHLGCSGGALLNLSGEMVGLLTSVAAIQGVETPGGFAIPVNAGMRRIIDVLKRGEEVDYGFLGVGFDERVANGKPGIPLTLVGKGSPAEVDGKLKELDEIVSVNGEPITDSDDIYTNIGMHLAGTKVKLQVRQGNNLRDVEITLGKLHVPGKRIASSFGARPYVRGFRVDYASLVVQQPPRWFHIPKGVLISDVKPDTPAGRASLKAGDVITHVNGVAVASPTTFYEAVAGAVGAIELTMYNFPQQDPPTKIQVK